MSAKEMFEKLGYELVEKNDKSVKYRGYNYIKNVCNDEYIIEIWKNSEYEPCYIRKNCTSWNGICNYYADEIKAINKQMEELGWIE